MRVPEGNQPKLIGNMSIPRGRNLCQISVTKLACALIGANLLLNIGSAWAGPAYLTNFVATVASNRTVSVSLGVGGGSNGVPYDLYKANTLPQALWSWLGPAFAGNNYTFSNQPLPRAFFTLGPPPATMVVAWGDDFFG